VGWKRLSKGPEGFRYTHCARIVAVADVFDALTSKRRYKEPFGVEHSLAVIRKGRGIHFDPDVADAFFAVQDEIRTVLLIQ